MNIKAAGEALAAVSEDLSRIKQADAETHDDFIKILDEIENRISSAINGAEVALREGITYLRQHLDKAASAKAAAIDTAIFGEVVKPGAET